MHQAFAWVVHWDIATATCNTADKDAPSFRLSLIWLSSVAPDPKAQGFKNNE